MFCGKGGSAEAQVTGENGEKELFVIPRRGGGEERRRGGKIICLVQSQSQVEETDLNTYFSDMDSPPSPFLIFFLLDVCFYAPDPVFSAGGGWGTRRVERGVRELVGRWDKGRG